MKIYGISGLGADKRVFNHLQLDHDFIPIDWIQPERSESLQSYAFRLSEIIDPTTEFGILGVSFGGLVAIEISKILNPQMTILVSSAETKSELRKSYRTLAKLGILKVLPSNTFNPPKKIAHFIFGTKSKKLLNEILDDTDLNFAKWAVNELINWNNLDKVKNLIRIHGTHDKLIPITNSENVHLIDGGQHLMIVDRASDISNIINEEIKKIKAYTNKM